jgi:hypothetical protein
MNDESYGRACVNFLFSRTRLAVVACCQSPSFFIEPAISLTSVWNCFISQIAQRRGQVLRFGFFVASRDCVNPNHIQSPIDPRQVEKAQRNNFKGQAINRPLDSFSERALAQHCQAPVAA